LLDRISMDWKMMLVGSIDRNRSKIHILRNKDEKVSSYRLRIFMDEYFSLGNNLDL